MKYTKQDIKDLGKMVDALPNLNKFLREKLDLTNINYGEVEKSVIASWNATGDIYI